MSQKQFTPVHTSLQCVDENGVQAYRVIKTEKLMEFDTNSYAKLNDCSFHNGTISVRMKSRFTKDTPDFARGFIGIAFRIAEDDSRFECFYVRPTNGRNCDDPIRRSHGCQYFCYPDNDFAYFRDHNITDYEAQVDIDMNEWIDLKAVIHEDTAQFYINDMNTPVLTVDHMFSGSSSAGSVGLFVDIGTEGYFMDLSIQTE